MAATGIDSQRQLRERRRKVGRKQYGESSHHFEELLHGKWKGDSAQFYFFDYFVLHESLGGATAPQQRIGFATKNRKGKIRQKKEIRQRTEKFYYLFIFLMRRGHSATGEATVKEGRAFATDSTVKDANGDGTTVKDAKGDGMQVQERGGGGLWHARERSHT